MGSSTTTFSQHERLLTIQTPPGDNEVLLRSFSGQEVISQLFRGFRRTPQTQRLPVEMAYSYPVPGGRGKVIVFGYYLSGRPPEILKVSTPRYCFEAEYPSEKILRMDRVDSAALPVPLPDGETLGSVEIPPAYLQIPYEEFQQRQQEFERIYGAVLTSYFAGQPVDPESARWVLEQLPVFGKKPLVPLLRATSPQFFRYLEGSARL